jgi:AAA domain
MCLKDGIVRFAEVSDHITPHRGDPALFEGPLQSLCKFHHDAHKQQNEALGFSPEIGLDGYPVDANHPAFTGTLPQQVGTSSTHPVWFRKVFVPLHIVCGPPCAGKSTYVQQHAAESDLIICFDQIAIRLFGVAGAAHTPVQGRQIGDVLRVRNELLADLMWSRAADQWSGAYLIVGEPTAQRRQWWQDRVQPHSITVLATSAHTCRQRMHADSVAGDVRSTKTGLVIDKWWSTYTKRKDDIEIIFP